MYSQVPRVEGLSFIDRVKRLQATVGGRVVLPYLLLNEDNHKWPGHNPSLDNQVFYELRQAIEGSLSVVYNILDHSMDNLSQAWESLEKYLSLFVSLIETVQQEDVAAFLDERRYEHEKLSIRFPILILKICQDGGQRLLTIVSKQSSQVQYQTFTALLRRYFSAVLNVPADILKAFPADEVQMLLNSAQRLESRLRDANLEFGFQSDLDLRVKLRHLTVGDGSSKHVLRLVEGLIESESRQHLQELAHWSFSLGYIFGVPQSSVEGDDELLQSIILTFLRGARDQNLRRSFVLGLMLLTNLNSLTTIDQVVQAWHLDTQTGFYLPDISKFRNMIENLCSQKFFMWLIHNSLICCLHERYTRDRNGFSQAPYGPHINLGPPEVIVDTIKFVKHLLIRNFVSLCLELTNHTGALQCLDSLDHLLSGRVPAAQYNAGTQQLNDPDTLFITSLNQEYFVALIRDAVSCSQFRMEWKWDLDAHHYKHIMVRTLEQAYTSQHSVSVSTGLTLFKQADVEVLGNNWKNNFHLIEVARVTPTQYISRILPFEEAKIKEEIQQKVWNERQHQKMLLQMKFEQLLREEPRKPALKPEDQEVGVGGHKEPSGSEKPPEVRRLAALDSLKTLNQKAAQRRADLLK